MIGSVTRTTIAAIYCRKSTDQRDRDENIRSVAAQGQAARAFIEAKGWTVGPVFVDDGISGAVFAQPPGLQRLLAALKPAPTFQALVVESQSRIGRETLDTLFVMRQIERAKVEIWGIRENRRLSRPADSS